MIVLKVNDKKVECPSCWEEAKLKHFQAIMRDCIEGDNPIKVFSILTGTNYQSIDESQSEDLDAAIYQATAFVYNQPQSFREAAIPKSIKIQGKNILIPKHIQQLTVGQNFQVRQALAKAKNLESVISIATAVYLQPIVDEGKFDFQRAKELEVDILEMNIFDVFPVGFFLLKRLNNSGGSGMISSLQRIRRKINRMLSWPSPQESISLSLYMTLALLIATPGLTDSFQDSCSKSLSMNLCHSFCCGKGRAISKTDLHYLRKL